MIVATDFFNVVRARLFGGRLSQQQVDGIQAIVQYYQKRYADLESLAYILATAYHETGKTMAPVREGFATTNTGAIKAVTALYQQKRISTNYALPQKNGHSYYGRGLVQITWPGNYQNVGKKLGVDLYNNPDLALQLPIAVQILVEGMVGGWFTGKRLADYFFGPKADPIGARKIINGTDKAALIASYYNIFLDALT